MPLETYTVDVIDGTLSTKNQLNSTFQPLTRVLHRLVSIGSADLKTPDVRLG